jgi:sialate O-acetylesterase
MVGDAVLVWSPRVTAPMAVRFGWHELAVPNLANKEGLPASPFRTDSW